jgi:hypothetical protein
MKKTFRQKIDSFYDQNSRRTFANMEFERCRFVSCAVSITLNPKKRSIIRNVKLTNCELVGCSLWSAVVEDTVVTNLKTSDLFRMKATVFKHVVFKGKIDRIMVSPYVWPGEATPAQQKAFDEANKLYYSTVDWALDISEGEFMECELQCVPAHLVRRDPETQMIVTREKALEGTWRKLDLSKTYWATSLEFFLERGDPDVVLVAPKRHPNYLEYLDGLKALRDIGTAEPN